MFPPSSSLTELNEATHDGKWKNRQVEWFLVTDQSRFHTYVKAVIKDEPPLQIRIDWHDNSRLCFERFLPETMVSDCIEVGKTKWFCRECIVKGIESDMKTYNLFQFNCRTVAFIILTKICRFDSQKVEALFDSLRILCGIDERECVSTTEISHYLAYTRSHRDKCTLF